MPLYHFGQIRNWRLNYMNIFIFLDKYPKSCKDYFQRDDLFALAEPDYCLPVTINPNPTEYVPPFQVTCCKRGDNQSCTEVT